MILKLAIRNLARNTRRTLAILLTVAMGSGSLYVFHGFNAGIMNQYRDNTIHSRYGHGQINIKGYNEQVFEKPWEHWIENYDDLASSLKKIPGVTQLFPRLEFFALLTNGRVTVAGRGQGISGPDESAFFNTLNVEEGVTLSDQKDGVLLGKGLARALDAKPGDRITVLGNTTYGSMNALDLVVTGVFHTGSKDFDDVVFRLPLDQAQALLDTTKVEKVALGLASLDAWTNVSQAVSGEYPDLEATPFAVLDKVYYQHSVDWLNSQFGIFQSIILIIVIMGIFNTVSTGILERKQEIGNLRANGESFSDVMKLVVAEGAVIGCLGAFAGLLAALVMNATLLRNGILMPPAPGLTRQFHVVVELQADMALKTFLLGVISAVSATAIAGWKVVRMPIGDALRSN